MQTVDLSSAPKRATANETPRAGSAASLFSSEPFDAIMGRALAHGLPQSRGDVSADERPKPTNKPANRTPRAPGENDPGFCANPTSAPTPKQPDNSTTTAQTSGGQSSCRSEATAATEGNEPEATPGSTGELAVASAGEEPQSLLPQAGIPQTAAVPAAQNASESEASPPDAAPEEKSPVSATQSAPPPAATEGTPLPSADWQSVNEAQIAAETSGSAELALEPAPPGDNAGISAAQQSGGMKKADKTEKNSARAEQKLPVVNAVNGGDESSAGLAKPVKIKFLQRGEVAESAHATAGNSGGTALLNSTDTASTLPGVTQVESSSPVRTLDRAQELMSLQAVRLREMGTDSLQVVIKPGPGTQLSLNLQMRDGSVEMTATLNRGDFELLNRHWTDLQQQLEARGIRLAPLNQDASLANNANQFQRPDRRNAEEHSSPTGEVADMALFNNVKSATTAKPSAQRGWESWA